MKNQNEKAQNKKKKNSDYNSYYWINTSAHWKRQREREREENRNFQFEFDIFYYYSIIVIVALLKNASIIKYERRK